MSFFSPFVIDFGTCKPLPSVPKTWGTEQGGKDAARFASLIKYSNPRNENLEVLKPYWSSFRLMGRIELNFDCLTETNLIELFNKIEQPIQAEPTCAKSPWSKLGDPAEGGLNDIIPARVLLKALIQCGATEEEESDLDNKDEQDHNWQIRWLQVVSQLNEPGGTWGSPFALPYIFKGSIQVTDTTKIKIPISLYVCRLLFYLIADEALAEIIRPLTPVGIVHKTFANASFKNYEIFSKTPTISSPFSVGGIMRASEHTGYATATQPPQIALPMKAYQLQTLQWMLDQERMPRGLNGCFWETRSWGIDKNNNQQKDMNKFHVSLDLGELRLEMPPLVRGGLLCEEMGLGKTLELVALICATKNIPPTSPQVPPKRVDVSITNATLIVAPDTLIVQWEQEIKKSCNSNAQLKVMICIQEEKRVDYVKLFQNCDICLTTFRMVENDKHKILQKIMWRRVVIDEMQMIRSSTTKVAKMCENLSAHARWMVSGTPLYSSVKDLNGLLNFLQVIPFSLSDAKDGFWNQRIGQPLADQDYSALELLHLMLNCIMIRHSKAQKYISGPFAGMSILQLPKMNKQYIGLDFDSYEEEASYRQVEALGLRAAIAQLNSNERLRQDRPAVVAIDSLRQLCVSPNMIAGGNGVTGDVDRIARLWRTLIPMDNFSTGLSLSHHSSSSFETSDFFKNPVARPGDQIRDFFLTQTSNSGKNKSLGQADIALRLEQAQIDVQQKQRTLAFEKAGSFDGLPKRRWKWLLLSITSGRFHLLQLTKFKSLKQFSLQNNRLVQECPILFRRACISLVKLRQFTLAQHKLDGQYQYYYKQSPMDLMDELELEYNNPTFQHVELTEGIDDDQEQLWFRTNNHPHLPSKLPVFEEKKQAVVEEEEDDDENYSNDDDEDEVYESKVQVRKSKRIKLAAQYNNEDDNDDDDEKFDFYANQEFWRKAFCKCLMLRHRKLKEDYEIKQLNWTTSIHPGFESPSIEQMIACTRLNSDVCFEALFWYETVANYDLNEKKIRAWFPIKNEPIVIQSNRCARVTFLDGQERIIDESEMRLVYKSKYPNETQNSNNTSLSKVLEQLRLWKFLSNFNDLIGPDDFAHALNLSDEELSKRFMNTKDLSSFQNENEVNIKKIKDAALARVEKFREASYLNDVKNLKFELTKHSNEIFLQLSQLENKIILKSNAIEIAKNNILPVTYSEKTWDYLWKLGEGSKDQEQLDWITVAFGLKGDITIADRSIKERIPLKKLRELQVNDDVLVCLNSSLTSSRYLGWFKAKVVQLPSENLSEPIRWQVKLDGGEEGENQNIKSVASDYLRSYNNNNNAYQGKKKRKKQTYDDNDDDNDDEQYEEDEEEDDEDEDHHQNNNKNNLLGYEIFPNGLIRMRLLNNAIRPIIQAKQRISSLIVDITAAKAALPDLERFANLLVRACERGGLAGAQLASQQGFQALEQLIERDPKVEDPKCTICLETLSTEPVILGCLHLFCKECLFMQKKAHDATLAYSRPLSCALCRREINAKEMFLILPSSTSTTTAPTVSTPSNNKKVYNNNNNNNKPHWTPALKDEDVNEQFSKLPEGVTSWDGFSSIFVGLPRQFQTFLRVAAGVERLNCDRKSLADKLSTKMSRVVHDIQQADGKVVIFSQFHRSVALMMTILERANISAVKIARGDPIEDLGKAVETFNTEPNCKVLVLHSGSGAAGLTLTVATHVFLLEPFLKAGEEAQAVNRVHRIGQMHDVNARCYYMKGTVEERILAWRYHQQRNEVIDLIGEEDDKEDGLVVPTSDDQSKSVASLSNEFLAYVLGSSSRVRH